MKDCLRIANCSGFYGDRLSAAMEMVQDGPIDVLTGDYLAELTLIILLKDKQRDQNLGYAKTFLKQLESVARSCIDRNIKIVVNAGGLNPSSLAAAAKKLYTDQKINARIAWIDGDDLLGRLGELQKNGESFAHLDTGEPLSSLTETVMSANAYLGGFSTAQALKNGADLVICPRITDAALVVGPSMWRFDWARDNWDKLASAVVAGHVIECGTQCTGGNYSFFKDIESLKHPGFPIVEMYEDGSFIITKHPETSGEVSVGTVTAQLLYEISGPRYENPDVVARFDTIQLAQEGPDRVRVTGVKGEPAPSKTKVCINYKGGYKNECNLVLTGLDIEAKAILAKQSFWEELGGQEAFSDTESTLSEGEDFALLTLAARDGDQSKVGRRFFDAIIGLALANIPGFKTIGLNRTAAEVIIYWPALVSSTFIHEKIHLEQEIIPVESAPHISVVPETIESTHNANVPEHENTRTVPLGMIVGARSGDKGGNANVGIWTRSVARYDWLHRELSPERFQTLYPEAKNLLVERYSFPNLLAFNFVIHGLLGEGVSASLRPDPQAKMLGEELRAKKIPIPIRLLE